MKLNEAIKLIETTVKNYIKENKTQGFIPVLVGPPGIGKTAMLHQMAEKNNWGLVPIHIAQIPMEMLSGIPIPNYDEGTIKWTEPEFIQNANKLAEEKEAVILFFDDIHTAREDKQELFFELAVNRSLHGFRLKDNVFIISAGNFKITQGGKRFLTPILSRFAWWNVELDGKAWLKWAMENVHPTIVIYFSQNESKLATDLLQEPEHLSVEFKGFPTPRTWTMLSEQLYMLEKAYGINLMNISNKLFTDFDTVLRTLIVGTIGSKAGEEFYKFLKLALDINMDEIFKKDLRPFLEVTNPAKKYYLLFAITGAIANDLVYELDTGIIKPKGRYGKKLFTWLDMLYKIYQNTGSKLFMALVRKAMDMYKVESVVNGKRVNNTSLYTSLSATALSNNFEDMLKHFEGNPDPDKIRNIITKHLSYSNFI